ncbi:DUF2634 domain-containing protein [Paenibacillus macerans]|uniref:DUF2634 domain-containing protein n=1 Tax=Paenibacillus macerans TaxID=44252 RepID=UPI00203D48FE|nr:DUF2634 domain-containing protein [Paenibacillus macerans]MCM3699185.1 DUF2634 domain-containing protein [Paenibacillus macerans]
MDKDQSLFPDPVDLEGLDEVDLVESVPSESKWTYVIDYRIRQLVTNDDGMPKRTTSYAEYLVQTALKILNTERFQYVVYDGDVGVEKSEWKNWTDEEITRDIEEALAAHAEITKTEVQSLVREGQNLRLVIDLTGLAGTAELEEDISI